MEIQLTSEMFEQGSMSISVGQKFDARVLRPSNFAITSKELIQVPSCRKISIHAQESGLPILYQIFQFDKEKKFIGDISWKQLKDSIATLSTETVYIALKCAINGGQAHLRPWGLDTISLVEPSGDWRNVTVNEWSGGLYEDSSRMHKTLTEWGLKAGDTITLSNRIRTMSGKKLRSRIEWYNSGNDRTSVYGNVIQNGEGVSTVTAIIPSGYSDIRLYIDANLSQPDIKTDTVEQVKDSVFVLGSSVPSNLNRGGGAYDE